LPYGAFPSPADNNPLQEDIADAWTSEDINYGLVPVSNNPGLQLVIRLPMTKLSVLPRVIEIHGAIGRLLRCQPWVRYLELS
jgi:hypothetical protein